MQIFTSEMLLEMLHQAHEIKQVLFDTLLSTAWQSVLNYFGGTWTSILQHNWSTLSVNLFMLTGIVVFIYRLIRKNLVMAVRFVSDRY